MTTFLPGTFGNVNGLDCLRTVDTLHVKRCTSLTGIICCMASEVKFDFCNDGNERIFQALETSTRCGRFCCVTRRPLTLRIIENNNQDIILLKREFKCCSGCSCCGNVQCCSQEIVAESPPGNLIGSVSQIEDFCRSVFTIKDAQDNHVLNLRGPPLTCDRSTVICGCEKKFTIIGTDGITEVGAIYKKYCCFLSESMTSGDRFLLKVPMDLDVKMKTVSLAALFLIYM